MDVRQILDYLLMVGIKYHRTADLLQIPDNRHFNGLELKRIGAMKLIQEYQASRLCLTDNGRIFFKDIKEIALAPERNILSSEEGKDIADIPVHPEPS